MKVLKGDSISKQFVIDKDTTSVTVNFLLWNQWYNQGGPCARIVDVKNDTKNTNLTRSEAPSTTAQTYQTNWKFNLACDLGDLVTVTFSSPDPGRETQRVRVTNVSVDTTGTGD